MTQELETHKSLTKFYIQHTKMSKDCSKTKNFITHKPKQNELTFTY